MKYGKLEIGNNAYIENQDGYLKFTDLSIPTGNLISELSGAVDGYTKNEMNVFLNKNWIYDWCDLFPISGNTFYRGATNQTVGCQFMISNAGLQISGIKFYGSLTYPDALPRTYQCKLWEIQNSSQTQLLASKNITIETNGIFSVLFDSPVKIKQTLINKKLAVSIRESTGQFYVYLVVNGGNESRLVNLPNSLNGFNSILIHRGAYAIGDTAPTNTGTTYFIVDPIIELDTDPIEQLQFPTEISNNIIWLRSDKGLYKDTDALVPAENSGDLVYRWNDYSGNNNHFNRLNHGILRNVSNIDNIKAVTFINSTYFKTINTYALTVPFTLIVVYSSTNLSSYQRVVDGIGSNWLIGVRNDGGGYAISYYTNGFATSKLYLGNEVIIHMVTQESNIGYHYLNGKLLGSINNPGSVGTGFYLGSANEPFAGNVFEFIAYNKILTSNESNQIHQYLSNRYDINLYS